MNLFKINENIFIIMDFWDKNKCLDFIAKSEERGYQNAKIDTSIRQRIVKSVRNNKRVMYKDIELANEIWETLSEFVPKQIGNSKSIGLNELFRFYRYNPNEEFKKHRDQSYIRNANEASYYTFMIYLNDGFVGGETTFPNNVIKPVTGMALIFLHDIEHAGSPIKKGTKYVLRTDIMYKFDE
jgi:prolyl 4-hydroxylase